MRYYYRLDDEDIPIYQPAEDSELLLETAREYVPPGSFVIETGVGTGYVAQQLVDSMDVEVVGTDINPAACRVAYERGIPSVRATLLTCFSDHCADAVIFNPPYLPPDDRLPEDWGERAVVGGPSGIELTIEWIRMLPRILRPDGIAICLASSLGNIDRIRSIARSVGFEPIEVGSRRWPHERLVSLLLA